MRNTSKPDRTSFETVDEDDDENSEPPAAAEEKDDMSAKSAVMIDAFKMKLLKLLELDKAPEPNEINLNENPIPEPILRELMQLGESRRRRRHQNPSAESSFFESRFRSKRSLSSSSDFIDDFNDGDDDDQVYNVHSDIKQHDSDEEDDENEIESNESVRFNGSVVQQVTLLPKKCFFLFHFTTFITLGSPY